MEGGGHAHTLLAAVQLLLAAGPSDHLCRENGRHEQNNLMKAVGLGLAMAKETEPFMGFYGCPVGSFSWGGGVRTHVCAKAISLRVFGRLVTVCAVSVPAQGQTCRARGGISAHDCRLLLVHSEQAMKPRLLGLTQSRL